MSGCKSAERRVVGLSVGKDTKTQFPQPIHPENRYQNSLKRKVNSQKPELEKTPDFRNDCKILHLKFSEAINRKG